MEPEKAPKPRFLTDVILELGLASEEAIADAIEAARLTNKTAEQLLVEQGHVGQDQMGHALAARYETEYVDLAEYPVDMDAACEVTRTVARRCGVVPIAYDGTEALIVAIYDSSGVPSAGDIAALTRLEVRPVIASKASIEELIDQLPEREVIRPGRDRRGQTRQGQPAQAPPTNQPSHDQSAAQPAPQPPRPQAPSAPLSDDLLERVSQLADTSRNVDLSPDLRLVGGAEAGGSAEQNRDQLRSELDRLVSLEREFRMTLGQVSERMRAAGALPGSNERIAELEELLRVAESGRDEAESERDELRRRLVAIRDALGRGEQL